MLFRVASALAVLALASQAVAEEMTHKLSARDIFGLQVRDGSGYQPTSKFCKMGATCAEACGAGYQTCPSSDNAIHCFNQGNKEICCSDLSGSTLLLLRECPLPLPRPMLTSYHPPRLVRCRFLLRLACDQRHLVLPRRQEHRRVRQVVRPLGAPGIARPGPDELPDGGGDRLQHARHDVRAQRHVPGLQHDDQQAPAHHDARHRHQVGCLPGRSRRRCPPRRCARCSSLTLRSTPAALPTRACCEGREHEPAFLIPA